MNRMRYMVTFARVVQAGSFVGAAERLGQRASVVSKHVAKLEQDLGVKLLNRTTRRLSLTEAGTTFYEYCARIIQELEQAELALGELQAEPRGHIRVATTSSMCTTLLAPMIPAFLEAYPKVQLDITVSDHLANLVEEGYDLAIRVTPSPAENLVARKLAPVRFSICASPEYFAHHGRPQSIDELAEHQCINYPYGKPGEWVLIHQGRRLEVPVHSQLSINSFDTVKQLVLRSGGLALLPNYVIANELRSGVIETVMPDYQGIAETDLYAVYLPNRYGSPAIRAFVDYVADFVGSLDM